MVGYRLPTRVLIEPGCVSRLPEVVHTLRGSEAESNRILLVADPGILATEWPERVCSNLAEHSIRVEVFAEVEANPRTSTTERIADLLRDRGLNVVVGLGGGSVLDAAKAAAMLATNPGKAHDYEGKNKYTNSPLPFVAIPTTCGTGSEVTWVSVLSHEETRSKISVKGEAMFPNQALVDADTIRTLPPALIASTGVDALTHALEATTCTLANPVSDALAEKAIELLMEFLPRAFENVTGDDEARERVMRASTIAGTSFGNADVAAVHCLSETLGGLYDVPHGLANAILLAPVMESHRPHVDGRLAALKRKSDVIRLKDASSEELASAFVEDLRTLARCLEIPSFHSLGIPEADYPEVARRATKNGSNDSNPRPMLEKQYLDILSRLD